jgi:hypothetical protein
MNAATNNEGQGYWIGDVVEACATFTDSKTGESIDPTTVSCTFTPATGDPVTYVYGTDAEATRELLDDEAKENADETLNIIPWYLFTYTPETKGRVRWKVTATGTGASSVTVEVHVRE